MNRLKRQRRRARPSGTPKDAAASTARIDTNLVTHYLCGVKNVTISVKEQTLQWARVFAARNGTSVSKLLGELLDEKMRREEGYGRAMRRDVAREALVLSEPRTAYPSRDEVHERARLR